MKEIIIGSFGILLLAFVLYQKPNVVNPMGMEHSHDHAGMHPQKNNHLLTSKSASNVKTFKTKAITPTTNSTVTKAITGNLHFDQLTPEMQQSLKDSLLLENSTESIVKDDGTVVIPANGRVTQMPVAVLMPDGRIEIREYSSIPRVPPAYKLNNTSN